MSIPLFYTSGTIAKGATLALETEEAYHALKVLRMKVGDRLILTDGKGCRGLSEIILLSKHDCAVSVVETETVSPRPFRIHIAIAPTKSIDRFEWFLEKATELGIEEITPLICEHSERRIVKAERCHKILLAAMKQSEQSWLPVLHEAIHLDKFVKAENSMEKFIGWCGTGKEEHLAHVYHKGCNAVVLIGPEGDFSDKEVALARSLSYVPVNLGPNRLRTETAGVAACSILNVMNAFEI
ncbi:MAG: 16S rRNA (uracil(1498)-N(3))-methyltransferase [Bacteroidota bacterium]